jgi:hypothetical protein
LGLSTLVIDRSDAKKLRRRWVICVERDNGASRGTQ